jgi:hypothetical protein
MLQVCPSELCSAADFWRQPTLIHSPLLRAFEV